MMKMVMVWAAWVEAIGLNATNRIDHILGDYVPPDLNEEFDKWWSQRK